LPEDLRQSAEARFGHSFANVRVHAESEVAGMATAARARAFTLGRHVVFGPGQYQPGSPAGAALMWHELAHVAATGDRGTLLRAPLYGNENLPFTPPPKGLTEPQMRDQLDKKVKKSPPDITSWSIKGAKPTDEAFIFLEAALFEFGTPDRRDSVARLEMPIGWEKGTPPVIPMGLVAISVDDAGRAVAELVSPVAIALSPSVPGGDAAKKLKADYGIDAVPGDKAWQPTELDDVVQALGLLKGGDRTALKGVQLMRFTSLPKNHAGEFNIGGGVAKGATAVQAPPTLKLADSAFGGTRFEVGPPTGTPLPGSERDILHEVGHAVEQALERAALEKADKAAIGQNVAAKEVNAAVANVKKATGTAGEQKSREEYTKRKAAYDKAAATAKSAKAAYAATLVPATVLASLQSDVNAKKTAYEAARKAATAATAGMSAADTSASAPYRTSVDALAALIGDFTAKAKPGTDLDPLDDALAAAKSARMQARADLEKLDPANPVLAAFAAVESAQDDWTEAARVLGHARGRRTLRLQKFVDLVKAAGITPLTKYARDNWPAKPQEFYAETYSLWLTEPDFLKSNYPALFRFFESGDYAK
jgi:hypothetical protein